jgi:hypothetical protein
VIDFESISTASHRLNISRLVLISLLQSIPVDANENPEYNASFEFTQPRSDVREHSKLSPRHSTFEHLSNSSLCHCHDAQILIDTLCSQSLCIDVVDLGAADVRVTLGTAKLPLTLFAKNETSVTGSYVFVEIQILIKYMIYQSRFLKAASATVGLVFIF